jgi:hypothetical protein
MLDKGHLHEMCIKISVDIEGDPKEVRNCIIQMIKDKIPKNHGNYPKWCYEIGTIKSDIINIEW